MIATRLIFSGETEPASSWNDIHELIVSLCCNLQKYGNLWGDYVISHYQRTFSAYVNAAHSKSLHQRYWSENSTGILQEIVSNWNCDLNIEFLDEHRGSPALPLWRDEKELHLFTHAFENSSPISMASTGDPLPVCFLPIPDHLKEEISYWNKSYKSFDVIALDCGALEMSAYKQLACFDSEVNIEGRYICKMIEEATGIDTYYFLHRYWGRKNDATNLRCPSCGDHWHFESEEESLLAPNLPLTFKCRSCRLCAIDATMFNNPGHAQIGEYQYQPSP